MNKLYLQLLMGVNNKNTWESVNAPIETKVKMLYNLHLLKGKLYR